jgi:hypothetical protein
MKTIQHSMEPPHGAMGKAKHSMSRSHCTTGSIYGGINQNHESMNSSHCNTNQHHCIMALVQHSKKANQQSIAKNHCSWRKSSALKLFEVPHTVGVPANAFGEDAKKKAIFEGKTTVHYQKPLQ